MRLLFTIDKKDYDPSGIPHVRNSARCISIRDRRVALIRSTKHNFYVFPGGGIAPGETSEEAVIREAREEAGLVVIPRSIRPYGYVRRAQKVEREDADYFLQDNLYYLCDVERAEVAQSLDAYEAEEGYRCEWIDPRAAIRVNLFGERTLQAPVMLERETRILQLLLDEGYFD